MIEGYAKGMLKTTYQKTKRPDKVIRPNELLLELQKIVEATGTSFTISRTEEDYANIRIANKPHRINYDDDLATVLDQLGVDIADAHEQANASQSAVRLAEENGIDLLLIEGSGQDGRVLKRDVEKYIRENSD